MKKIEQQIFVIKNNKSLIELIDRLEHTEPEFAAKIHAGSTNKSSEHKYSLLKIQMLDYSKKDGNDTIFVSANISPSTLIYLLLLYEVGKTKGKIQYSEQKIMPGKSSDGNSSSKVTNLKINRNTVNFKGETLRNPWSVEIEEGTGTRKQSQTGGYYVAQGTYKRLKSVRISMTDKDFFTFLKAGESRLNCFEKYWGTKLFSKSVENRDVQIAKITTLSGLVEFTDKTDTKYNDKEYSLIGMNVVDFEQKNEKNKSLFLSSNLSTNICHNLYHEVCEAICKEADYEFSEEKIMPNVNSDGLSDVRKVKIVRSQNNKKGEPRRQPWFVVIETGKSQVQEYSNGAKAMKAGTFKREHMAYVCVSDKDLLYAIYSVCRLIDTRMFLDYCSYCKENEQSKKNGDK